ncbi:hypothetical protein [Streptomyces sp. NPDC017673]|uniref:hypothetical protein n=1 Tax=unclassified Streptomyces TaxID=2593676 RepID=UPI0037A2F746
MTRLKAGVNALTGAARGLDQLADASRLRATLYPSSMPPPGAIPADGSAPDGSPSLWRTSAARPGRTHDNTSARQDHILAHLRATGS